MFNVNWSFSHFLSNNHIFIFIKKITIVDDERIRGHANWLFTILLDKKDFLQKKLRSVGIETNQVHFRNDRYSIFKKFIKNKKFRNMDNVENKYLVLPIHTKMKISDANYIAKKINEFIF